MTLRNYGLITSIEELQRYTDRLLGGVGPIGFDIETGYHGPDQAEFSLHPETAIVVGISFTDSTDWARYCALNHDYCTENLDNLEAARLLWPVLATGRGVAHNVPFELRHLARWFLSLLGDDPEFGEFVRASGGYFPVRSDTQVEAYLAAEHPRFGLKYLVKEIFGHEMTELIDLFPGMKQNKKKTLRFNVLNPLDVKVRDYACEDSLWCLALHQRYYEYVRQMPLYRVDMAIATKCVPDMEDFGVKYDWELMRRGAEELRVFRDRFNAEIMAELSEMVGEPVAINLGSPAKISEILYGKLGMRTTVYTAKTRDLPPEQRKMSTGRIALAALAKKHPVVKKINQWKEMRKLEGTYLDKYESVFGYAEDGHTHPSIMNAYVITGRFSVASPPYQQSPKKYHFDLLEAKAVHAAHEEAHGSKCKCKEYEPPPGTCFTFNFRDSIVAPAGHYILGFDLSQAELRAIAGEAKEPALLRAFETGQDVHVITAALMLGIPISEVTEDQRAVGKMLNFALLYGMGFKSLADRLAISVDEAKALYERYFSVFSNIARWTEQQVAFGKRYGYVVSRFGRKLPIWEYQSDKVWIRQKGDRACVNYSIQGAATGDFMRISMVRARAVIHEAGLKDKIHMVMNVHDALEFYVDQSVEPQEAIRLLQPAVIFPVSGWPEMKAEWHLAKKWGSPIAIDVARDGQIVVDGNRLAEASSPEVEEDEETGEEILVLPDELTDEAVAEAVEKVCGHQDRRLLVVVLDAMPDGDSFGRFCDFLDSHPGWNAVVLRTPEGELELNVKTNVTTVQLAEVSLILGPVEMFYDASTVDSAALVADLVL